MDSYTLGIRCEETTLGATLPTIVGTIENVTAAEGKTAKFTCVVKNLNKYHHLRVVHEIGMHMAKKLGIDVMAFRWIKDFLFNRPQSTIAQAWASGPIQVKSGVPHGTVQQVVWFHVERNMLLTIHTKIVTRINRFRVIRDDPERWTLEIREVMQQDKGAYACQVNTEPQLRKIGYLDVVVSPEIDDSTSSPSTVVVKENGNVTLTCQAVGNPHPNISWIREDHGPITMVHRQKVYKHAGPTLELRKVSRSDMGAYLCIASNGYPPSVSKRTELFVEFSPIVIIPNQLMAAPKGTSVSLECITEAYPRAVIYWKYKNNMVMSTNKYHIQEKHDNYRTKVHLTINDLVSEDFGSYMCNSRNSFGENVGVVELNELTIPDDQRKVKAGKRPEQNKEVNEIEFHSTGPLDSSKSQSQVLLDLGSGHAGVNTTKTHGQKTTYNHRGGDSRTSVAGFGHESSSNILNSFFPDQSAGTKSAIFVLEIIGIPLIATVGNSLWR